VNTVLYKGHVKSPEGPSHTPIDEIRGAGNRDQPVESPTSWLLFSCNRPELLDHPLSKRSSS